MDSQDGALTLKTSTAANHLYTAARAILVSRKTRQTTDRVLIGAHGWFLERPFPFAKPFLKPQARGGQQQSILGTPPIGALVTLI